MIPKTLTIAAAIAACLVAGGARADDAAPASTPAQSGTQQRLRDGSGAGGQHRYGAQGGAARGTCDGTMRRDQLRDGTGGGARHGRMGGGRR